MKYIRYLILLITSASAVNYQERFLQANEYYKDGNYQEAEKLYSSIPNKGATILYNLGNCAYQQDKKGMAVAYWKKAQRVWSFSGRKQLAYNIELVEKNLTDDQELKTFISSFKRIKKKFITFIKSVPLLLLQACFLALWLFLFAYLKYLYKKKHSVLIVFLFLLIAIFGTLLVIKYSLRHSRSGVIVARTTKVLSGPDEKFSMLGEIPEILEVVIKEESDGYYKICFEGKTGWVKGEDVVEV